MEKQIDSLFLGVTPKTNTTKTVETTDTKSEPSLFDSLIKNSIQTNNETEISTQTKETKVSTPTNEKVLPETQTNEVKEPKDSVVKVSLLDRLIQEAKKDVKVVKKEEVEKAQESNKSEVSQVIKEINTNGEKATLEVKKEAVSQNVKNEVAKESILKTPENKDTQEVAKNVQSEEVKSLNSVDTQEVDEKVAKELASLNTSETEDIKVNVSKEEIKTVTPESVQTVAEDGEPKDSVVKVSLLDRLIQEAKKDVKVVKKEEIEKAQESNKSEVSQVIKEINTNGEKATLEVKKEAVSQNVKNEVAKESILKTPENKDTQEVAKNVQSEEVKSLNSVDTQEVDEKVAKELASLNTSETEDIKVNVSKEEIKTVTPESVQTVAEDGEPKDSVVKVSLLDRLIQEAKKDVKVVKKEEIEKAQESNKSEVSQVIKEINTNGEKATLEVKKEAVSQNVKNEVAKESILKTPENKDTQEVAKNVQSEEVKSLNSVDTQEVDEKVAKELASLNTSETEDIKVNVSKNDLKSLEEPVKTEKTEVKSLMDKLIEKNRQEVFGSNNISTPKQINSNEFLTNVYLSSQKTQINNQSLINKKEAANLLSNGSSLADIQTSADMLDLGLEDLDVEKVVSNIKKLDLQTLDRANLIDKLAFNKNIVNLELKDMITTSVEASKALLEDTINVSDDATLSVTPSLAQNIQARIIGARQQMGQMMSDIAKQMYENYKPPVTVFRINLNPATLGAISILMKNDKDNGISISMNVSNVATLDSLKDSQGILKTSLNNAFNNETEFNLDFSSSNQNSNNSSNNQNQQSNQNNQPQFSTQSILQLHGENKDLNSTDYM